MIKSKFSFWVLLPPVLILLLFYILYEIVITSIHTSPDAGLIASYVPVPLFAFVLVWLLFGELRTKEIKVIIDADTVKSRKVVGLGPARSYRFDELEGYKTSVLPATSRNYEYLYLIGKGKKVVKLSQFYHRNYEELKKVISAKTKYLGDEKFSYRREFKEIFQ